MNRMELSRLMDQDGGKLPLYTADGKMAALESGPDREGFFHFQVPGEPATRKLKAESINHMGQGSLEEARERAQQDTAVFGRRRRAATA